MESPVMGCRRAPLDHVGDFIEMMIAQRLLDGLVRCVDRHLAWLAHHVLLSAIALTAGTPKEPGSSRLVDLLLT
jgi:hypothetical protein